MSTEYSTADIRKLINEYLDPDNMKDQFGNKFTVDDLLRGFKVELEHADDSKVGKLPLNVTNRDPLMTTQIALAHLMERRDYYDNLDIMEDAPHDIWRGFPAARFWKSVNLSALIIVIMLLLSICFVIMCHLNGDTFNMILFGIISLLTGLLAFLHLGKGIFMTR